MLCVDCGKPVTWAWQSYGRCPRCVLAPVEPTIAAMRMARWRDLMFVQVETHMAMARHRHTMADHLNVSA